MMVLKCLSCWVRCCAVAISTCWTGLGARGARWALQGRAIRLSNPGKPREAGAATSVSTDVRRILSLWGAILAALWRWVRMMISGVEQRAFYRTHNGSIVFVVLEQDSDGDPWLLVLSGGSDEWMPGDAFHLRADGSILGHEQCDEHPMLLRERMEYDLPALGNWMPLEIGPCHDFGRARSEWLDVIKQMQVLLIEFARHVPPAPEVGAFYRTLNGSIVCVLAIEGGAAEVAVLDGGVAEFQPGYVYRMAADGSPGNGNPLGLALALDSRIEIALHG